MKKIVLFTSIIFGMILLAFSVSARTLIYKDTCDSTENWTTNGASYGVNIDGGGLCQGGIGAGFLRYKYPIFNISRVTDNVSIEFQMRVASVTNAAYLFRIADSNDSVDNLGTHQLGLTIGSSTILSTTSAGENPCAPTSIAGVKTDDNTSSNFSYHILVNNSWSIYVNGTLAVNNCAAGATNLGNGTFPLWGDNVNNYEFWFDNLSIWNLTTVLNVSPMASNVSITPLPLNVGVDAKGHATYSDEDGDENQGNFTRWYINQTAIAEANNNYNLLAGNVTLNSNITFEVWFYDGTFNSTKVNSSMILVGDSISPDIFENSTQGITLFTSDDTVNITVNVTDASGNIDSVKVIINRTGTSAITNETMILLTGSMYQLAQTYAVDDYEIVSFWARDGSTNVNIVESGLTFTVTSPPSGGTPSGGGGGASTTTIISLLNGTPLLSFGIMELTFFVVTTPSQKQKIIKFINLGNVSFVDGKIGVQGSIEPYIQAKVCNLNVSNCKTEDIELKSGQNAFLVVDGNFTSKIESGVAGIIRFDGNKVFDLGVVVDRPPLYNKVVLPFVRQGFSEPIAYLMGYSIVSVVVIISTLYFKSLI